MQSEDSDSSGTIKTNGSQPSFRAEAQPASIATRTPHRAARSDVLVREKDKRQRGAWSYISDEEYIPQDHLAARDRLTDVVLKKIFSAIDAGVFKVWSAVDPTGALAAGVATADAYSVRTERLLTDQSNYNVLFRWFVRITMEAPVRHSTTFTKNRDGILEGDIARAFFDGAGTCQKPRT